MNSEFHGLGGDTAAGALGVAVSLMSWYQVITSLESVIIGFLTIVLVGLRIYRHLRRT